ncbi:hypothetical protein CTU88_13785 [Streptomyces sp. JV178]|uniref:ATP-binding protein n=1 Tax=Streptomyces sp. JV178 TaxID=858632 RepID=UPI000C1B47D9|nr:ATP-binding protein [Streptomyces sp. JV178]PIM71221.1 hypothetical protein CTU88_13785 [Streptomyces sp. JV178]
MADLLAVSAVPATGVRAATRSTPGHLAIDLDVTELAVPIVRTIVRAHLRLWGLADLTDGATFVITELLTNVLRHVQPTLRTGMRNTQLTLTRLPGALNVCVRDFDPALPKPTHANDEAEHGRGLPLVMAFADDFGCSPFRGGKDVWATFLISNNGTSGNPQALETT